MWKMGPDAPVCGALALRQMAISLPAEPVPGVVIAEDQRHQTIAVCEEHDVLAGMLDPQARMFSIGAPRRTASRPDMDEIVAADHTTHRVYRPNCLGCDLDFGARPDWTDNPMDEYPFVANVNVEDEA